MSQDEVDACVSLKRPAEDVEEIQDNDANMNWVQQSDKRFNDLKQKGVVVYV